MSKLIVVSGLPGSGKSTVAEGLAEKLRLPIFSVDPIEASILKSGLTRSFETGLAAYLVAETLAAEQLRLGLSVILDAVSPVKEAREIWQALSERYNSRLMIIECVLERGLHQARIESRVRHLHGLPEVTWQEVENRRHAYLAWEADRLVLDTSGLKADNLDKALEYIQAAEKEHV